MLSPRCSWIVANPQACDECALNPHNPRADDAEITPVLRHVFFLEALQAAGAQFNFADLTPPEWRALIVLKGERNAAEIERMKKKR